MNRFFLFIIAILFLQSCAAAPPVAVRAPDDGGSSISFPRMPEEVDLVITGKVRLDLPRYRVRGVCHIVRSPEGSVRLDFMHSSLFGSYRENATILIEDGRILLFDNERQVSWDNESALALLEDHFGFRIYPDDLLHILLLESSSFDSEKNTGGIIAKGDDFTLLGRWHDRSLTISGKAGMQPSTIRFCNGGEKTCYLARYRYKWYENGLSYPEKIVVEKENSSEKLSLTVTSVSSCKPSRQGGE